jgi:hypothetical protein
MQRNTAELLIACVLSLEVWACAGASRPAPVEPVVPAPAVSATAAAAPTEPPAPVPAAPPAANSDASLTPAASAEPTPAPADTASESRKPLRSPIDILTGPDTAFLIDYSGSAPIEAARRTCAEKSAGEPEAQAKCLSDARDAFKADVIRFRKDGSHWSWTVYKRNGNRLDEVSSGRVTLSEASPNSVNLKFVSDKGVRPLLKNKREAVITVPNDYSFEVDDTEWGRLQYDAKIGLVAN